MAKKRSGWLLGCMIGCGAFILLGIIAISAAGFWAFRSLDQFDHAVTTRKELEERFGKTEEFVPPPDGAVPADRMETFLSVRLRLEPFCGRFRGTFGVFERMEEMEGTEPTARDVFGALRSVMGIAPLLGEFFAARNQALLDGGMGMGEYTYIYVLVHRSWLSHPVEGGPLESDSVSDRVRGEVLQMLRAQRERIPGDVGAPLDAEIAAMEADPDRLPWQEALPEALEASFEPYRERLEELYCPAAADVDLARNRKRGLSIQAD